MNVPGRRPSRRLFGVREAQKATRLMDEILDVIGPDNSNYGTVLGIREDLKSGTLSSRASFAALDRLEEIKRLIDEAAAYQLKLILDDNDEDESEHG